MWRGLPAMLLGACLAASVPAAVHASACGGQDHRVAVRSVTTAELRPVLARLQLPSGPPLSLGNSPGGESIEVTDPVLSPTRLSLRTERGPARFELPPRATLRESDITFVVNPRQQGVIVESSEAAYRENEAVIYRELTWQGWLLGPQGLASGEQVRRVGKARPLRATLILQGTGNGCVQETDFIQWVLWVDGFRVAGPVGLRP